MIAYFQIIDQLLLSSLNDQCQSLNATAQRILSSIRYVCIGILIYIKRVFFYSCIYEVVN